MILLGVCSREIACRTPSGHPFVLEDCRVVVRAVGVPSFCGDPYCRFFPFLSWAGVGVARDHCGRICVVSQDWLTVADCVGSQGLGSRRVEPLGLGTGRGDLFADCSAVLDWVVAL